jgi:hypothetical protein
MSFMGRAIRGYSIGMSAHAYLHRWWSWWTGGRGLGGVAQGPNPALLVWFVAMSLRLTGVLGGARAALLTGIAAGALLVWSFDELFRGVSPIRRLMGAAVLAFQMVLLL